MKEVKLNLCMFEGALVDVNKDIVVYIKREKEGYVIDVYSEEVDGCIDSLTIWEDDFK